MKKNAFYSIVSTMFISGVSLLMTSCADDNLGNNSNADDSGAIVRFNVTDVQEDVLAKGVSITRAGIVDNHGLQGRKLLASNNTNLDVCLVETTVEGVNPVKANASTRAEIRSGMNVDFSTSAIRGNSETSILTTPEWFHAQKTKGNGTLYSPIRWEWSQPYARFFAVYPEISEYSKMTINNTEATGSPSVEFEVETDVKKEVDLLTACSGDVHYSTRGVHPETNLDFRHALTAIRFAVGQNLSWNKTIDRIELQGVLLKSKYKLSSQFNGLGAGWDHSGYNQRGNVVLSNININTNVNPNTMIVGNPGDNNTFYMIPQQLTGHVTAYFHCTDGTTISVPLSGEWSAGTTRTYKLSQRNSDWSYQLTSTSPATAAYNQGTTSDYTITSFREDPATHVKQAVAWKVIGYDANNDGQFSMGEKPSWLSSLSKTEGSGGTVAETGTASLIQAEVTDRLALRNKELREATPLGKWDYYYDLSTKGETEPRNTANCYVISAPGHYRIPLVYGNAIKNGVDNPSAFRTSNTGAHVLRNFKDHAGNNITDPWIEKTNNYANNGLDGAEVIWDDCPGANMLHLDNPAIVRNSMGQTFLHFQVDANIQSGNAVIVVKKAGVIVWSWHLWFAPKSSLRKMEVTEPSGSKYNFSNETLGWKPTVWKATAYSSPRTVKVRVEQSLANNGVKQVSDITVTQNPYIERKGFTTLYQWGRKDAFPGTDVHYEGMYMRNTSGDKRLTFDIQYPYIFYINGNSSNWTNNYPGYYNLWSMNNTTAGNGLSGPEVVKTVYDPSPVGFKIPTVESMAFLSIFNRINGTLGTQSYLANGGHLVWTNDNHTEEMYFPCMGVRGYGSNGGLMGGNGSIPNFYSGCYWLATPINEKWANEMEILSSTIAQKGMDRTSGYSIRPISE